MLLSSCADMRQLCQCMYSSDETNTFSNVTRNTDILTFHIIDITLNKYACDIAHICPNAVLLWSTYRPQMIYIQFPPKNLQQVLYKFAKYVPETNMPVKCQIYATHAIQSHSDMRQLCQ